MRAFLIRNGGDPVALVFHDYLDRTFYCRSKRLSFLRAFNAMCERSDVDLSREGGSLRAVRSGPEDYGWIDEILDQLCKDYWSYSEIPASPNEESSVDAVIQKHLA